MISTQTSNDLPSLGQAASDPSPSSHDRPASQTRFFHGGSSQVCDEAYLAHWWEHADLPHLGALIEALLAQSIALSQSHLQLQARVDALEFDSRDLATRARAMHLGISAMADFQGVRIRTVARFARTYIEHLTLSERLSNLENGIRVQQATAVRMSQENGAGGRPSMASIMVSDLHATQERLRGARDQVLLDLCEALGEPPAVTYHRLQGHALPSDAAAVPRTGTPESAMRRRPDLISASHILKAAEAAGHGASSMEVRCAKLAHECLSVAAGNEVERALRALRARIAELVPLRAGAAAAEAAARRINEAVKAGRMPIAALAEAHHARCARKDLEIKIRGESHIALVDLFETLGGGWESERFLQEDAAEEHGA